MKRIIYALIVVILLSACNGVGGTSSATTVNNTFDPGNIVDGVKPGFTCLPSISDLRQTSSRIAYAGNCSVANAKPEYVRNELQKMAVALVSANGKKPYCSGTPIKVDYSTHTAFILTAAHCVVGGDKNPNTAITPTNITVFNGNRYYVSQALDTMGSDLKATIKAVYVPKQYCYSPAFKQPDNMVRDKQCAELSQQDADLAILKVDIGNYSGEAQFLGGESQVRLADSGLSLSSPTSIMALGYGYINDGTSATAIGNTSLNYITYYYLATNSYNGYFSGLATILNGYFKNGKYYSIICGGDSGGGDFYWDGGNWNLIGVHSYGSSGCGQKNPSYVQVPDISADVRPFSSRIKDLIQSDISPTGCASTAENNFVCKAGY